MNRTHPHRVPGRKEAQVQVDFLSVLPGMSSSLFSQVTYQLHSSYYLARRFADLAQTALYAIGNTSGYLAQLLCITQGHIGVMPKHYACAQKYTSTLHKCTVVSHRMLATCGIWRIWLAISTAFTMLLAFSQCRLISVTWNWFTGCRIHTFLQHVCDKRYQGSKYIRRHWV